MKPFLVLASASIAAAQFSVCKVVEKTGCYQDDIPKGDRVLPNQVSFNGAGGSMTKEVCAELVAMTVGADAMPNTDVGVEYGSECYYGTLSSKAVKKDDGECNMPCVGNSSETCGGDFRIEVFRANCTKAPPQPPTPPGPLPTEGPCDILAAAGNPCVAAHSTVRALYKDYEGPLYNLTRVLSDGSQDWKSIFVLEKGGFANASAQEDWCANTVSCLISNVYDQSPNRNDLGQRHKLVEAMTHKLTVGPNRVPVYGMWFEPGYGYHVDETTNIATGNDPESIYAVMSGKHYNGGCCFDYGNSETDDRDDGCGTMEAIYFGNAHWNGNTGAGPEGPWAGADLEQGMYYGKSACAAAHSTACPRSLRSAARALQLAPRSARR